ncbi:MAG TPA: acetylglutamate kinase [Elusimicrobiota bacterium]|nr:acetylglutamate kinase [Elusimicrobiota bacterium]
MENQRAERPIVIKYGGSLLEEPGHRHNFLRQIATLRRTSKIVLVHGGGKEISREMEKSGMTPRFVEGRRYTDEQTMTFVEKVLQRLNASIVAELAELGAAAHGYSGRFEHVMEAKSVFELGRVGSPNMIHENVLRQIIHADPIPVFYSVAEDVGRHALNVNADDFALALAVACKAKRLVFLTDAGAVLDARGYAIATISSSDVEDLIAQNIITGGMVIKARACVEALRRGVGRVDICKGIDGLLRAGQPVVAGTSFVHDPTEQN